MIEIMLNMVQAQFAQIFHHELFSGNEVIYVTIVLITVGFFVTFLIRPFFKTGPYYTIVYVISTLIVFMFITLFQDDFIQVVPFDRLMLANVYYGILCAVYLFYRFFKAIIRSS